MRDGEVLAVTTDLFLENTHFRQDWHSPESAGHRCLARGLSDLAATGARPLAAFLSVAVPPLLAGRWLARFLDGLLSLARLHRVPLAGGDTAQSPLPLAGSYSPGHAGLFLADIVLTGAVPRGQALGRDRARPGDRLYVTGSLGGAAAELAAIEAAPPARLLRSPGKPAARSASRPASQATPKPHPQLFPQPRLAQGLRLRSIASAAIDLSDGLSTDLSHLCAASGVSAVLQEGALPIHPLARRSPAATHRAQALSFALHGGEDYELLFAAPATTRVPSTIRGIPVTCIGELTRRRSGVSTIRLQTADGRLIPVERAGWEHFRSQASGDHALPKALRPDVTR